MKTGAGVLVSAATPCPAAARQPLAPNPDYGSGRYLFDRADDGTRTRSSWLGGPAPFRLGLIRVHPAGCRGWAAPAAAGTAWFPEGSNLVPAVLHTAALPGELENHVRGRRPDADPSALPVPGVPPLSRDGQI